MTELHIKPLCRRTASDGSIVQWRRKLAPKERFYISPQELHDAVVEMKLAGHITDRFARHLMTIQDKVLHFPRFVGYPTTIKEEISSYNLLKWVRSGWKTVDVGRGSIFAYITTATHLNMLTALKKYFRDQERQSKLKEMLAEEIEAELPAGTTIDPYNVAPKRRIYEEVSDREMEWLAERGYDIEQTECETDEEEES